MKTAWSVRRVANLAILCKWLVCSPGTLGKWFDADSKVSSSSEVFMIYQDANELIRDGIHQQDPALEKWECTGIGRIGGEVDWRHVKWMQTNCMNSRTSFCSGIQAFSQSVHFYEFSLQETNARHIARSAENAHPLRALIYRHDRMSWMLWTVWKNSEVFRPKNAVSAFCRPISSLPIHPADC
jgi:hypothetical protein